MFGSERISAPGTLIRRTALTVAGIVLVVMLGMSWYWSRTPDIFFVTRELDGERAVTGYSTTDTLIRLSETLLEKPGGYLTNDVAPPSVFLDNMPNWEFGVLTQIRDLARVMRNDYARSQSQSTEDPELAKAEPKFFFDNNSWILPPSESEYRHAIEWVKSYRSRLNTRADKPAQFFARADNLREWLSQVEKRLGSLSQRLSASVGQSRVNTDMQGEPDAQAEGSRKGNVDVKTPWLELDDVFYESRGTAWALIHILRAAEFDFADVLAKKNAAVSVRQIIRELEASLQPMRSPIVLNGSGFGLFANHSLVMASYLSRANAAVIDLRDLLDQG